MNILETINILEAADIVMDLANCISKHKGINKKEAYHEAIEELKKARKEYKEFII